MSLNQSIDDSTKNYQRRSSFKLLLNVRLKAGGQSFNEYELFNHQEAMYSVVSLTKL